MNEKIPFSEKHPRINLIIGLFITMLFCIAVILLLRWMIRLLGIGLICIRTFLITFVNSTDTVIVVAMITGALSFLGVVLSSIIAKVVEFRFNKEKYLYEKREEPYKKFVEMIYTIMDDVRKPDNEKMSENEMVQMISEFSKGLTLWGSDRVVKKWLKYRRSALNYNNTDMLLNMEDIIFEIRKDIGLGHRLKRGDMLSFFVNDIEKITMKSASGH